MSGNRPRTRFVPTLTEVVRPSNAPQSATVPVEAAPPEAVAKPVVASRSVLDATVDELMPQAREHMRQRLHTAAYELAEEQLRAMEDHLRQQLRNAVREAAGMGKKA